MIVRIADRDRPFVMIDKRPLENPSLSLQAKGLLAYLMSRPDNWSVNMSQLKSVNRNGYKAIQSAMRELARSGHARLNTLRDGGRIKGKEWHIYEKPFEWKHK